MTIPGSANPLLLASAAADADYQIERSLRFNSADSAYLSRTPASAGNRKTWTWAGWVNRAVISTRQNFFHGGNHTAGSNSSYLEFSSSNTLRVAEFNGSAETYALETTQVFRDPSAWLHLAIAIDTTQATASNRIKVYVNGSQVTTFSTSSYPSQNLDTSVNNTVAHSIGYDIGGNQSYLSAYLADIHFIDGQALDPTSFGEFDATTGVWVPKAYTGTYGTNGFHLDFADNSNNTATTLGKDTSGNGNNWTPNNLSIGVAGNTSQNWSATASIAGQTGFEATKAFDGDASSASSTYYFPGANGTGTFTFAQSVPYSTIKIWYGRTNGRVFVNGVDMVVGTTGYAELTQADLAAKGVSSPLVSIGLERIGAGNGAYLFGVEVNGSQLIDPVYSAVNDSLVDVPTNGGETDTGAGGEVRGNYATWNPLTANAVYTLTNGNLDISDTGSTAPVALGTIGINSGKFFWEVTLGNANAYVGAAKVSSRTSSSFLGAQSGQFMYNTAGVSDSFINGSAYNYSTASIASTGDIIGVALDFESNVVTFYKNGISQGSFGSEILGSDTWAPAFKSNVFSSAIFNFGQRPFAYTAPSGFKALNTANLPAPLVTKPSEYMDVVTRAGGGTTQTFTALRPGLVWEKRRDTTSSHYLFDVNRGNDKYLSSDTTSAEGSSAGAFTFSTNSYTVSSGFDWPSGASVVDWIWDAGSSTVTNTQGSISSQVRANASAGFSIVTYTGNGTLGATVGHGLGVKPSMVIIKSRSIADDWLVAHDGAGVTGDTITGFPESFTLFLQSTAAKANFTNAAAALGSSSVFAIADGPEVNQSSATYVAYCWAPVSGYSSFGSYVGNGSSDGVFVYTGFRPRWILIKASSTASDWVIFDTARSDFNLAVHRLFPAESLAEAVVTDRAIDINSNGFKLRHTHVSGNSSGATYIYAAFAEHPFQYARAR